ncbi:hypothetical protein HK102_004183, partial [Quaeritorhiza haematococci]
MNGTDNPAALPQRRVYPPPVSAPQGQIRQDEAPLLHGPLLPQNPAGGIRHINANFKPHGQTPGYGYRTFGGPTTAVGVAESTTSQAYPPPNPINVSEAAAVAAAFRRELEEFRVRRHHQPYHHQRDSSVSSFSSSTGGVAGTGGLEAGSSRASWVSSRLSYISLETNGEDGLGLYSIGADLRRQASLPIMHRFRGLTRQSIVVGPGGLPRTPTFRSYVSSGGRSARGSQNEEGSDGVRSERGGLANEWVDDEEEEEEAEEEEEDDDDDAEVGSVVEEVVVIDPQDLIPQEDAVADLGVSEATRHLLAVETLQDAVAGLPDAEVVAGVSASESEIPTMGQTVGEEGALPTDSIPPRVESNIANRIIATHPSPPSTPPPMMTQSQPPYQSRASPEKPKKHRMRLAFRMLSGGAFLPSATTKLAAGAAAIAIAIAAARPDTPGAQQSSSAATGPASMPSTFTAAPPRRRHDIPGSKSPTSPNMVNGIGTARSKPELFSTDQQYPHPHSQYLHSQQQSSREPLTGSAAMPPWGGSRRSPSPSPGNPPRTTSKEDQRSRPIPAALQTQPPLSSRPIIPKRGDSAPQIQTAAAPSIFVSPVKPSSAGATTKPSIEIDSPQPITPPDHTSPMSLPDDPAHESGNTSPTSYPPSPSSYGKDTSLSPPSNPKIFVKSLSLDRIGPRLDSLNWPGQTGTGAGAMGLTSGGGTGGKTSNNKNNLSVAIAPRHHGRSKSNDDRFDGVGVYQGQYRQQGSPQAPLGEPYSAPVQSAIVAMGDGGSMAGSNDLDSSYANDVNFNVADPAIGATNFGESGSNAESSSSSSSSKKACAGMSAAARKLRMETLRPRVESLAARKISPQLRAAMAKQQQQQQQQQTTPTSANGNSSASINYTSPLSPPTPPHYEPPRRPSPPPFASAPPYHQEHQDSANGMTKAPLLRQPPPRHQPHQQQHRLDNKQQVHPAQYQRTSPQPQPTRDIKPSAPDFADVMVSYNSTPNQNQTRTPNPPAHRPQHYNHALKGPINDMPYSELALLLEQLSLPAHQFS